MPISSDPSATCWIHLRYDDDAPAETRAEFECRFITISQRRKALKLLNDAGAERDDEKATAILNSAMAVGFVGWRNVVNSETREPIACEPGRFELLDGALTPEEKTELVAKMMWGTGTDERSFKKKLASAPTSDTDSSTAPAPPATASAPTGDSSALTT